MNRITYLSAVKTGVLLLSLQLSALFSSAQVRYTGSVVDLVVSGTSTLHDWTMKSAKADCTAQFDLTPAGAISGLNSLNFSTPVNGLKSEHSGMDKNAYKALKSDKTTSISFVMTSATITPAAAGGSTVKCTGKLTIAGTTKDEELVTVCKPNADNSITVTGSRKISMQEFSITPPTFMMGTIKTGNDIVISFTMILRKS